MSKKSYNIVSKLPLACFYYKGTHSHPIKRTVVIVEDSKDKITGYELREGKIVRNSKDASKCIKSYDKNKIAKWGDYSRLRTGVNSKNNPKSTTLRRFPISEIFSELV